MFDERSLTEKEKLERQYKKKVLFPYIDIKLFLLLQSRCFTDLKKLTLFTAIDKTFNVFFPRNLEKINHLLAYVDLEVRHNSTEESVLYHVKKYHNGFTLLQ